MKEKIEELGEARAYDAQARTFLEGTGSTIEARYIETAAGYFGPDDEARDVYGVRITRGTRSYAFKFGKSVYDTEERIAKLLGKDSAHLAPRIRKNEDGGGLAARVGFGFGNVKLQKFIQANSNWANVQEVASNDYRPTAYSVLASMQTYEPADNIDDFAAEYGYTKPSEAMRVFEAVKAQYTALKTMYNDEELEALRAIS